MRMLRFTSSHTFGRERLSKLFKYLLSKPNCSAYIFKLNFQARRAQIGNYILPDAMSVQFFGRYWVHKRMDMMFRQYNA